MATILRLTLKSAIRNPFLLFWSIILPVGGTVGAGIFINSHDYSKQIVTGMMAVSILFYGFMTTSFAILTQRRRGVYHLLRVTPLPLWQYICSISGAWTLISLMCALLVLLSGIFILDLSISIPCFLALIPLLIAVALSYIFFGFFIASLCHTENNVSLLTNIITMPLLICSSAFYSLDNTLGWIQTINRLNPFQWFINGLRSAFDLRWDSYFTNTGLVLLTAAASLLLALKTFRYTDN